MNPGQYRENCVKNQSVAFAGKQTVVF